MSLATQADESQSAGSHRRLRLGTRGSQLARWQADWVAARLRELGVEVELVLISTRGDVTAGPLGSVGGQGLFTKEIQRALLAGEVDLAVHSLKDLPTQPVAGLCLAAVPERESVADVLVAAKAAPTASPADSLDWLPKASRIGSGSLRRRTQLLHARSDLQISDIRGNVETRLRKLDDGEYDAIVLAEAGLKRLGLAGRITQILPAAIMLPAIGQGALGIEARADDGHVLATLAKLNDRASHAAVLAERTLLAELQGGCLAPIAAWARVESSELRLDAAVLSLDGVQRIALIETGPLEAPAELGARTAEKLLALGAGRLVAAARQPQA